MSNIQNLMNLAAKPYVIQRWHASRKLTAELKADLPWMLQIGHRTPEAQEAWKILGTMAHNAVWHLVGGCLRHDKMSRSALADVVQKMANEQ